MTTLTTHAPLWLSDADVTALVTVGSAIEPISIALRATELGAAIALGKSAIDLPGGGVLQNLGAALPGLDLAGAKTWVTTPRGAAPTIQLWRISDGALLAVVEATHLGRVRTGALAAVATRSLARRDASIVALIGAGRQAMAQLEAVCAVRPITEIRIYSRDENRRDDFAARVRTMFDAEVAGRPTIPETVAGAHIVTLVTTARQPILQAHLIEPGMHINAVGAIRNGAREFESEILARCDVIAVDDLANVQHYAQELIDFSGGPGRGDWGWAVPLGALTADVGTESPLRTTLYKGVGSGIADIALAAQVWTLATEANAGLSLT